MKEIKNIYSYTPRNVTTAGKRKLPDKLSTTPALMMARGHNPFPGNVNSSHHGGAA
jgi:hypothetical protein